MQEKLPVLREAIDQLKKNNTPLGDELFELVEELLKNMQEKKFDALQATEEKINKFLTEHEQEIQIGDRKKELTDLKSNIETAGTETEAQIEQPASRRERLRKNDELPTETNKTVENKENAPLDTETSSRRERWGKKGASRVAGISALLLVRKRGNGARQNSTTNTPTTQQTPPPTTPHQSESPGTDLPLPPESPKKQLIDGAGYEKLSTELQSKACFAYLHRQGGFSPEISAGIVGNIQQESKYSTTATGDGGTSFGLCQWHDDPKSTTNRRRTDLKNYHAQYGNGRPLSDYRVQLDFIKYELEGKEKNARENLKITKTPKESATVFVKKYERAGTPYLKNRIAYAEKVYAENT